MDPTDVILAFLTAAVAGSWGHTQWRLARVERGLADVRVELASKPDREELSAIWEELRKKPDRAELTAIWEELRKKPDREELTAIRADLTQIALAVGAARPKASEG